MNEHYCLYAITWAHCPPDALGLGVDPRFPVELIRYGQLAALASRIGLDQFDLSKLQEGTADISWVSTVATRHHDIIFAAAQRAAVLPMRLGIFFESRDSMIARLTPYEPGAVEFLRRLEDREEWAAKLYVDQERAEKAIPPRPTVGKVPPPLAKYLPVQTFGRADPPHATTKPIWPEKAPGQENYRSDSQTAAPTSGGGGTQYLVAKGLQAQRRRQVEAVVSRTIMSIESRLSGIAESWQRLGCLSHALTGRPEKMAWNAAFLLSGSAAIAFQAEVARLSIEWESQGLMVEATGPWPPYHFCPSLEFQQENSACPGTL